MVRCSVFIEKIVDTASVFATDIPCAYRQELERPLIVGVFSAEGAEHFLYDVGFYQLVHAVSIFKHFVSEYLWTE